MSKLSNMKFLPVLTKLLVLILLAKLLNLGLWWYLPSNGIDHIEEDGYRPAYKRIDFKNMLERSKNVVQKTQKKLSVNINTIILSGLYGKGRSGFAIVAEKKNPNKTSVIAVGDHYAGYILKSIEAFGVTFEKNSKEYILKLNTKKDLQTNNYVTPGGSEAQGSFDVHKGDINFYRKNPSKIWKDIAINEVFEGKKIKGFRVDRIAPNSKMARLGLKKGDVIIRANNRELNSYKAAIDLYKNIDNIDTMALTVLRNNQEKELIYEIR